MFDMITGLHFGSEEDSKDGIVRTGLYLHHDFYDPTNDAKSLWLHNSIEVAGIKDDTIPVIFFDNLSVNKSCLGIK